MVFTVSAKEASIYILPEYVRAHPEKKWDRDNLSRNYRLEQDIVELNLPNATGEWKPDIYVPNLDPDYFLGKVELFDILFSNRYLRLEHYERYRSFFDYSIDEFFASKPYIPIDEIRIICEHDATNVYNPGIHPYDVERMGVDLSNASHFISGAYLHSKRDEFNNYHVNTVRQAQTEGVTLRELRERGDESTTEELSQYLPMDEIRRNPSEKWNRHFLSFNREITLHDVLALHLPNATGEWNWAALSQRVSMDDIRANLHLSWQPLEILKNPELTMEDLAYLFEFI